MTNDEAFIVINGFVHWKSCSCGIGVYHHRFWQINNKGNMYYTIPKKNQCVIFKNGRRIKAYNINELEQKLKEHGII